LTNIFDNVRQATMKEAEKLRQEGLDRKEREATAPKQRERYVSKRNKDKALDESAWAEDPEAPTSPGKSSKSTDDDEASDEEEKVERKASRLYRCLSVIVKRCYQSLVQLALAPVNYVKRKWEKFQTGGKPPPPMEVFTDVECPQCGETITVQGLDQINIQEALFSRQWGLNRCAIYCPACNEVISGIAPF
jgi:hypothetical protein